VIKTFWILFIALAILALMMWGATLGAAFLEMSSFVILSGILAVILASGDFLIISLAVLLIAKKLFSRRPAQHEYDVDSGAWGFR
jgi:hypothetical protein